MPNLTRQVFDATASTYDRDRSRLIPGYGAFYGWAIDLIPAKAKTILDLGAGSGLLTVMVRAHCPEAQIHLMDFSESMLALARERLAGDDRLSFYQKDYVVESWPAGLCAVVSSLSVHHLDDEGKREVFRKAHAALRPGGVFVNADQVAGPTAELDERYKVLWLRQIRELGATEKQIEASLYRKREDRCVSVETQLSWLREAGFADADCWYKEGAFAVFAGTKE